MAEHSLIEEYLEEMRRRYPGSAAEADDAVAEVRDHLLASVEDLSSRGLDVRDAQLLAIARLEGKGDRPAPYEAPHRHTIGRRLKLAAASAGAVLLVATAMAASLWPLGNDHELARRLGFEPAGLQEPSRVDVAGVPLPRGEATDGAYAQTLRERMRILDR